MDGDVLSVERVIKVPADRLFSYVADAAKHPLIDGSGSVKALKKGSSEPLELGSIFEMSMKMGVSYSMVNDVIEFEANRRIAWQARPKGLVGRITGGRIWRYELEPGPDGTTVRESWDISRDHQRRFLRMGSLPEQTRRNMERTLERLEEVTSATEL